jgi:opine dehydrogenase
MAYKDISAPKELITRYFTEDVPTGLIPLKSLGSLLKIDTPIINSIINLSSILCGVNFEKDGRTLRNLKLVDYIEGRIKKQLPADIIIKKKKQLKT